MEQVTILRAEHIHKSFNGNPVLRDVQLELHGGRVHALCGENGAGKSTLLKVITGIYTRDDGKIYMNGKEIDITDVKSANKQGIYVVPQEMQILEDLTVAENIFIGDYPRQSIGTIDWKNLFLQAERVKKKLGVHGEKIDVHAKAGELGMGAWQLIEIMRALIHDNIKVLGLDEPTAALSDSEAETLFELIDDFRKKGVAIVYVSHRTKEIFQICDEVSVYRDGHYVGTRNTKDIDSNELIAMMIGRNLDLYGGKRTSKIFGEEVLRIENFTSEKKYQNIAFSLKKGEILGLYGLVGAGRTELMRGLFGLDTKDSGDIWIKGKPVKILRPRDAKNCGIGFVTENRREEGLMLRSSLKWNLSMNNLPAIKNKFGLISNISEIMYAKKGMELFNVKASGIEMEAGNLSGGNQQKVILAKWVMVNCDILIVDEPTRGVDVGTKAEVYRVLKELASEGKSIIMVSSELPEIIGISDRIIVMCEGKVTAELDNDGLTEEDVIKYAFS